jgi:hypothetical protein
MLPRLRTLALAFSVCSVAPLAACGGSSDPAAAPAEPAAPRTVASMLPKLTHSLTPAGAKAAFGEPDETTGSGLLIYVYRAEQGKKVFLSFPGFAPIVSARAVDAAGVEEQLVIRE